MTTRPRSNSSASADPGASAGGVIDECASVAIGLDVEQREGAEDMRKIGRRCGMQVGLIKLGKVFHPEQAEAADYLVFEQFEHPQHAGFAGCGQCPTLQAADADKIGT